MWDVGLGELLVIIFVGMILLGPDKLPDLAKQAGAMLRKLKDFANSARDELRDELGPNYADLELRDLDPRTIVRKHIVEAMEDAGDDETKVKRRGLRPLEAGESPPYDADAT